MTFEELLKLNIGDQVIINDPLFGESVYVLIIKYKDGLDFMSTFNSTLMVKSQQTIDGFNIRPINEDHPKYDPMLKLYAKNINKNFKFIAGEISDNHIL